MAIMETRNEEIRLLTGVFILSLTAPDNFKYIEGYKTLNVLNYVIIT